MLGYKKGILLTLVFFFQKKNVGIKIFSKYFVSKTLRDKNVYFSKYFSNNIILSNF